MAHTPIIAAIAAMAKNNVIGQNNHLPWHIPGDLQHLKKTTMGKPLIMGRKTYESLGRPLPGRPHIIVTKDKKYRVPSNHPSKSTPIAVVHSVDEGIAMANEWAWDNNADEIMIFGGGQIYAAAMPKIERLYLTIVDLEPEGDAFFPTISMDEWTETERTDLPATTTTGGKTTPGCSILTLDRK